MRDVSLAPAAVVRVAGWSVDVLDDLGDAALTRACRAADTHTIDGLYAATLEHERARLWHVAASPRFRAALALSSPALATRVLACDDGSRARRTKRVRHLETSLYRYLARAVSRTEPCGLWCGVALARPGGGAEQPDRVAVAPELGPLRAMFQALRGTPSYRARGPWRLNPTLTRCEDGSWSVIDPQHEPPRTRDLGTRPLWSVVARALADMPPGDAATCIARLTDASPGLPSRPLFEACVEAGVVIGGLEFPFAHASPFDAMLRAAARLTAPHRRAWMIAAARLARICRQAADTCGRALGGDDADPIPTLLRLQAAAQAELMALAIVLGVEVPPPDAAPLRCDWSLGRVLDLDPAVWSRLHAMAQAHVDDERRHGTPRWRRHVGAVLGRPPIDAARDAAPPLGAMVVRVFDPTWAQLEARGVSDNVVAVHGRHARHLARLGDPLPAWIAAQVSALQRDHGLELLDLAVRTPVSANVACRPSYGMRRVEAWSPELDDARVVQTPGCLALELESRGRRLVALSLTPVDIPNDARSLAFAATGFRRPELAASVTDHGDRLRLSEEILAARGVARFVAWRRWCDARGLDRYVRICVGSRAPLLVPSDSPLALDAALEGAGPSIVRVEAASTGGAWRTTDGLHATEFVVPLARHRHAWCVEAAEQERRRGVG